MKVLIAALFVLSWAFESYSQLCLNSCRDLAANPAYCVILRNRCNEGIIRAYCPLTCKICKPCSTTIPPTAGDDGGNTPSTDNTPTTDCEIEGCEDVVSADKCFALKNLIPNGCAAYPQSCRLTCGQCKPCPIPDPEDQCSIDCNDFDESCEHWKSQGYCNKSSEFYPFTSQRCPMSCGVCEACPTPEPSNTALPPTPKSCSENCEDIDESCNYWYEQGFCNRTDEFPYLNEVCALSCGECEPCPTSPPCDEDCEDTNENCEFWQDEGFCNESNGFPITREICPKSCGICLACPEDIRSTALPPTQMEFFNARGK